MERLTLEPVGIIHTEHHDHARTPIQPVCAQGSRGKVEIFPQFAEALDDIEEFSHLHLIYWLHRAGEVVSSVAGPSPLKVVPYLDDVPRGVFATRTPVRPNPLGLSLVRLVERHRNVLLVEDLDVLDGTPLLDIKPYVEKFDLRVATRGGWTDRVSDTTFRQRGERDPNAD
jgi:tRNA-Thr(GGU) m(6)t(6)A37 methyltransferase TsaA